MMKKMQNEKMVLQNMDSPFLVKMHYAFQTQAKLHFINEFMSGGTLIPSTVLRRSTQPTAQVLQIP